MHRMFKSLVVILLLSAVGVPVYGVDLTAQDIFEGMIYYENDQLEAAGINDYHCTCTQTIVFPGSRAMQVMEKDVYFMVPVYQLDMYDGKPAHIFEPDAIITTLEIQTLERLRDTKIGDVDCYVIRLTPFEAAFVRFPSTHYVAKDDFRKIRTLNYGSTDEFDRVLKTLDYTYSEVNGMMLLKTIAVKTEDEEGNLLHTVTAEYTDYEFDTGLTEQFFKQFDSEISINPLYN